MDHIDKNKIISRLVYAPDEHLYLLTETQMWEMIMNDWPTIWNFQTNTFIEEGAELLSDSLSLKEFEQWLNAKAVLPDKLNQ